MTMNRGKFVVIEGLEGAGKTSALTVVRKCLIDHGIEHLEATREPGGTPLAEQMRRMVKEIPIASVLNQEKPEQVTDMTELLLMYAARSQLVENVIKPALEKGHWVLGDRHDLSSQAYQGGGRGLDAQFLSLLREHVLGHFKPDLTLYLDIDPKQGLLRARSRGELDRIEQLDLSFFERTRKRYQEIAQSDATIRTIEAGVRIEEVALQIRSVMNHWLMSEQ